MVEPPESSTGRKHSISTRLKDLRFQSQVNLDDFDQDDKLVRQLSREVDVLLQGEYEDTSGIGGRQEKDIITDVFDISSTLNDAASALVDDSFLRCFKSAIDDPWNWNFYLFPLWLVGVVVRNCILFPLRLVALLLGFIIFFLMFHLSGVVFRGKRREQAERASVHFLAQAFIVSWTGVVRYHGARPVPKAGRVWVANHSSMIDYAVLSAFTPFAAIMQLHKGWVGVMQKRYLAALGCLWFNRTETKDRALVAGKMKAHIMKEGGTPLLIFPEGTCVNNEYCVMFKRGAFDLDATVCPIAIKYNKIFVDAFWNSKRQSFSQHLFKIMRSWALVADVWFLEPQQRREGETATAFASRVQKMIADKAGLKIAPWDGYLKYYNLAEKYPEMVEKQRKTYADRLKKWTTHDQ
jgi:glycerol-3-phosphate O-acyltransferase 3/4